MVPGKRFGWMAPPFASLKKLLNSRNIMINRYTPKDFAALWSEKRKFETWFDVELAACRAMQDADIVPRGTAEELSVLRPRLEPDRILEIEREVRHDVIAFLTHVEELGGPPARWLHRGLTSSDVLDTSLALLLVESGRLIEERLLGLLEAFKQRVEEHRHTFMIGRSHGIHAEPTSFGIVLAGHYAELKRAATRFGEAHKGIAYGKIAGAVGTYAHLTPEVEQAALERLGLSPETVATQVVPRDRHADYMFGLASVAVAIERFAVNVRHWQRSEVGEAEERFGKGQKGSSAMPHKRNPILSENLCGLARSVRACVAPALENVVLWHERDISHSSVERMLMPDATSTTAFMLDRAHRVISELVINKEQLLENLNRSRGLWASEGVLLELVKAGLERQKAYTLVQGHAMEAWHSGASFKELLVGDERVTSQVSPEVVEQQFRLEHALRYADDIIDRALK